LNGGETFVDRGVIGARLRKLSDEFALFGLEALDRLREAFSR